MVWGAGKFVVKTARVYRVKRGGYVYIEALVLSDAVMFTEKGTKRLNMLVKTLLLRRTKNQTDPGGKPLVSKHSRYVNVKYLYCSSQYRERKMFFGYIVVAGT